MATTSNSELLEVAQNIIMSKAEKLSVFTCRLGFIVHFV